MPSRVFASPAPAVALDGAASAIVSARRAALADRYAANALTVEWREFAALAPIVDAWRELAARALEPNVFYEPAFALAAAPIFGRGVGALLVWSGTSPRRLLGFFPARVEKRRYGLYPSILVGWTHPFAPLGVPLVEREAAEPIVAAWLAHIAADPTLPGLVLLPFLTEAGPFAAALEAILRRAQMPAADFDRHRRALLAPGTDRTDYLERALGRRRHKELRRQWRRLSETGAVLFASAGEPADVAAALDDFLALEAGGWKGRAGSAAAQHEAQRRFMQSAVRELAAEGKVAIDRILIDGRAVAATILLRSGRSAWFWKIAYDEAVARFSPGVILGAVLTNELVEDATILTTDSCASANHPMIDRLWRERLALGNRLIAVRPQAPFALVRRLEGWRGAALAGAKGVRDSLRRRVGR
jgi:CelD/BcsL family acetyltransferase involved in cellulose biosynthesis